MGKPLTLEATQALAAYYRRAYMDGVEGIEDEDGQGRGHIAWMIDRITHEQMPIDKASRWLGFVQASMMNIYGLTLEQLKAHVHDYGELYQAT